MSGGFGAGFMTLALLAAVGAVALGVTAVTVAVVVAGAAPGGVHYILAALLGTVLLLTGVAAAALVDEAPLGLVLFGAFVVGPLALAGTRARRRGAAPLAAAAAAVTAWAPAYLLGLGLQFSLVVGGLAAFGPATVVGAAVAGGGALLAERELRGTPVGAT